MVENFTARVGLNKVIKFIKILTCLTC